MFSTQVTFVRSVNLTEMCLNVIIHNLESIIFNDNIPEKNTNFLLRVYAEKVFKEYMKIKGRTKAKEDVTLWFLNPHVKSISLPGRRCTEKVMKQLQIVGPGITSLNLWRSTASESELSAMISLVPCVKILNLSFTSCTDNTLSVIQETCQEIETLSLGFCSKITDDGMNSLCGKNQSLKILDLIGSDIEDLGVSIILKGMPFLERIEYYNLANLVMKISDCPQKYDHTERTYNLTKLICRERSMDNSLKVIQSWIKSCPKIKIVHFHIAVKKEVLQACTEFQELEELKIKLAYLDVDEFLQTGNFLAPFVPIARNLKTLILSCLEIDTLLLIEEFRNLEKLYMRNVTFTHFDPASITCTGNKLDVLVIRDTDMTVFRTTCEAIVLLISLSKNVTELYIGYNRVLPSSVLDMILYSMKNLSSVHFNVRDLEWHSLIPFFDIPSLKKISVDGTDEISNVVEEKLSPGSSSTLFWRSAYDVEDFEDKNLENDEISLCTVEESVDGNVENYDVRSDYNPLSNDDSMSSFGFYSFDFDPKMVMSLRLAGELD